MKAFSRYYPLLQEKIVDVLGWKALRPIQEISSHAILDGNNCILLAPTAGGKTEASMFPILSKCLENYEQGLRVLYICPTKALLNNQESRLDTYSGMVGLKSFKWHGDVSQSEKNHFKKESSEILLTTPESLEVMLCSQKVPTLKIFQNLSFVVIDEIHALASSDRGSHLISLLERIRNYAKWDFQRIGLSATVGNPDELLDWLQGSSKNSKCIVQAPAEASKKQIEIKYYNDSVQMGKDISNLVNGQKSLLFCESRKLSESISGRLRKSTKSIFVHHSSLSKEEREESENQFYHSKEACIICTSTMELGIDVGDLDKVLQIDCPPTVSSFLQRMGRTGRRSGTIANTTFFVSESEKLLQTIAIVELARNKWIESIRIKKEEWHILLHQIMAICLERGSVVKKEVWKLLSKAICFSEITEEKFDQFWDYLVNKDLLHNDGNTFSMGLEAEKVFGRKNFMELYAVFSSPIEYIIVTISGEEIGTIEWNFLESLIEKQSSFFLSGIAWSIERIDWMKKYVTVYRSPHGIIPKWGGISPKYLSYTIMRKIRDLIIKDESLSYIDVNSSEVLNNIRLEKKEFLLNSFAPLEIDERGIQWFTYAGGFVNNTIRFAFLIEGISDEIQSNNTSIKINKENINLEKILIIVQKISKLEYWENIEIKNHILQLMPDYRLSKFQKYLPNSIGSRLVMDSICNIDDTIKFLKQFHDSFLK